MKTNEKKNDDQQPPQNKLNTRQRGSNLKNKAAGNQLTKDDPEQERVQQTRKHGDEVDSRQNSGKEHSVDPTSEASREKDMLQSDIRHKKPTRNDERGAQPYDEQQMEQKKELNKDERIVNQQEDQIDPFKYEGL